MYATIETIFCTGGCNRKGGEVKMKEKIKFCFVNASWSTSTKFIWASAKKHRKRKYIYRIPCQNKVLVPCKTVTKFCDPKLCFGTLRFAKLVQSLQSVQKLCFCKYKLCKLCTKFLAATHALKRRKTNKRLYFCMYNFCKTKRRFSNWYLG